MIEMGNFVDLRDFNKSNIYKNKSIEQCKPKILSMSNEQNEAK